MDSQMKKELFIKYTEIFLKILKVRNLKLINKDNLKKNLWIIQDLEIQQLLLILYMNFILNGKILAAIKIFHGLTNIELMMRIDMLKDVWKEKTINFE